MNPSARWASLAVVLGSCLIASRAAADIPPPDGYTEQCTVAIQQQAGEVCVACSTYVTDTNKCASRPELAGYTKRCQTYGASVWGEVWCKSDPDAAPPVSSDAAADGAPPVSSDAAADGAPPVTSDAGSTPAPVPPTDNSGCAVTGSKGWKSVSVAGLLAIALLLSIKRRRARC